MDISPSIQSFVLHFGEMGSRWGFNRTVGQIHALLMLSDEPLSAEQIKDALKISRGNVSMGIKELQSWQLIKVIHVPGDRKEYYQAIEDLWTMGLKVLEERRKREVDPTLSMLRDLLMSPAQSEKDEYAHQKMQEMHDLLELLNRWSRELQNLSPDQLKMLMQLGAGVGKVLEFKNKISK